MGISLKDTIKRTHTYVNNNSINDFNTIVNDADDYYFDTLVNGKNKKHLSSWENYVYRSEIIVDSEDSSTITFEFDPNGETLRKNLNCIYKFKYGNTDVSTSKPANLNLTFSGFNDISPYWTIEGELNGSDSYIKVEMPENNNSNDISINLNADSLTRLFNEVNLPVGLVRPIMKQDIHIFQKGKTIYAIPIYLRIGTISENPDNIASKYVTDISLNMTLDDGNTFTYKDNSDAITYEYTTTSNKYELLMEPLTVFNVNSSTYSIKTFNFSISILGGGYNISDTGHFKNATVSVGTLVSSAGGITNIRDIWKNNDIATMGMISIFNNNNTMCDVDDALSGYSTNDISNWRANNIKNGYTLNSNVTYSAAIQYNAYKNEEYKNSNTDMNGNPIIINITLY